ncbi:regulatory protein, luxR family [Cognatiyoonia sediminum]|uniref:Regulatory protein, luxR family n=1 Tax=Cognatiyoonia sediminum TaxID=1508389 RepID=A0A1M5S2L3_9RHOB|nr:helix-turn-helix transcriptional regulator [Cognatiyoonia sediminum]SHH32686.1 regulatory protein, luxR family [Cognatiyoonia sediminum]
MTKPQLQDRRALASDADWDDIISRVYDVALDPSRYETLLDKWETTMGPMRSHGLEAPSLDDASILGHFDRAAEFLERGDLATGPSEIELLMTQFDTMAAVIIDRDLSILELNDAAERVLRSSKGMGLSRIALDEMDRAALARQCARMMPSDGPQTSVFRVRAADEGHFIVFHMKRVMLSTDAPVVIAVTSDLSWPVGFGDILHSAFGLSKAEVEVVRLLVECCSLKEIAETRGRSLETVRGQLKTILSKTETRTQVELVRLTMSMMDIATLTTETNPGPRVISEGFEALDPVPFQTVDAPDGRSLDYLILGDPNGSPILYLHMDFGFMRWPASAEAEAKAMGLKIIAPVRGGFGHSSALPKKGDFGKLVAQDLITVLDAENVPPCPVISLGADHLFAIELDLMRPGQVTAVIAAGGVFPFTRPQQFERMHKWHRFIQAGARYTPQVLPFLVKAGFHLAKRGGKRAFVHSVFGDSKADIDTFEDPEVFEAMITGSEICLSEQHNAHESFARQSLYEHGKVPPELIKQSEGRFPFISFNGTQDPSVHPDTIEEYAKDYPWIDFRVYEDSGQLMFFRHWREVVATAKKYC